MVALQNVINDKKNERRLLLAKAEVLAKQIDDLEAVLRLFTPSETAKPKASTERPKPSPKAAKKK